MMAEKLNEEFSWSFLEQEQRCCEFLLCSKYLPRLYYKQKYLH